MEREIGARAHTWNWIALVALAAASFGLSYVHLGGAGTFVALAIAAAKVVLVALFFMELVRERFSVVATCLAALLCLATLMGFAVADVLTRAPPPLLKP